MFDMLPKEFTGRVTSATAAILAIATMLMLSLDVQYAFAEDAPSQALRAESIEGQDSLLLDQASKSPYAYATAAKVNKAALDYMTDMYIKEYPNMGTEIMYGSPKDNAVLKKLSNRIVKSCSSTAAKCKAIAKWAKINIAYECNATVYPIDVLQKRKSDCMGYAFFMQTLMRMQGIPAVVCTGEEGDMKSVLKLNNIKNGEFDDGTSMAGHAWVFAYYGGAWHLYDPLFGIYGTSDANRINSWYLIKNIEGVTPYYSGIDLNLVTTGAGVGICRVDGTMMGFCDGKICKDGCGVFGAHYLDLDGIVYSMRGHCENDGYTYVDDPSRAHSMKNGEIYTDGWIAYGDNAMLLCVRPNGIVVSNTFRSFKGDVVYLSGTAGEAFKLSIPASSLSMTDGFVQIEQGKSVVITTFWAPSAEASDEGFYACWYLENYYNMQTVTNKKLGVVNQEGVFTAGNKAEGPIVVCCTEFNHSEDGENYNQRSCGANSSMVVYVSASAKQVSIKSKNTIRVASNVKTVAYSKVQKKARTVKLLKVSAARGKTTFTKISGSKHLVLNKSTGKVTVKKGTKKGVYKLKVKVRAAGNSSYLAGAKTVTLKVRVK